MLHRIMTVLAALVFATVTTASAQTELAAASLGTQFAIGLDSNFGDERAETLHRILVTATFNPEYNLNDAVPSLVEVYRSDPNDAHRVMAAVALYRIGDEDGMKKVHEHLREQRDRRVQIVSIAAVRNYFGLEVFRGDAEMAKMAREILATR